MLYRRDYSLSYLRCANSEEVDYVLCEIHEGVCGNHDGARSLAGKALRAGYYWPTLHKDVYDIVRACNKCQWGIDIMGPFPLRKKQLRFLIVAINYFKKWVEAEPVMTITKAKVTRFVWKNIICRFGIPYVIISDNGKQFDNHKFQKFCQDLGVKNHYSSPRHPQANGQTEVTNKSLLKITKTRLEGVKGALPEELQYVL